MITILLLGIILGLLFSRGRALLSGVVALLILGGSVLLWITGVAVYWTVIWKGLTWIHLHL